MNFIDKMGAFATRAQEQLEYVQTEEATKTALVLPFLSSLGYNVFDPSEVVPEYVADVGIKKGEKVDYAVFKDGKVVMLVEVKWSGSDLSKDHASQLFRYFSVTETRFGLLTNGIDYRFFSDLDKPNRMDEKPFFEFNLFGFTGNQIAELEKFSKSAFELESILTTAGELKYTREIKRLIAQEIEEPSDAFVKLFAHQVYSGRMTQETREQFTEFTRRAFRQYVSDRINNRLKSALANEGEKSAEQQAYDASTQMDIETTLDEVEAFHIVKAIVRAAVDPKRIVMRDTKSYCGILLDDNNRKSICRLHFNASQKYVGILDEAKQETRIPVTDLNDIYQLSDLLRQTAMRHDT